MSQSVFEYFNQAISVLDTKVAALQAESRQHLQCRNGCSSCCENVQFRITYIEALHLFEGFVQLPIEKKQAVLNNIEQNSPDCPFLLNQSCSIYAHRPALCRAYGILIQVGEKLATCKLNFRDLREDEPIQKLDLLPYYNLLDDLSAILWKNTTHSSHTFSQIEPQAPKQSILEFMRMLLSPPWQELMQQACNMENRD